MNVLNSMKLGVQCLTYKGMESSAAVNVLVICITFGSVTRDTLAKNIFTSAVDLILASECNRQIFGKHTTEIINQGKSVLFNNTLGQVKHGAGPLLELLMEYNGHNKRVTTLANILAPSVTPSLLQDHALERILCAWSKQENGMDVIKLVIDNAFIGVSGGIMLSAVFMSALKRAVLDKAEYQSNTVFHRHAAQEFHRYCSQDDYTLTPFTLKGCCIAVAEDARRSMSKMCQQSEILRIALQLPAWVKSVLSECREFNSLLYLTEGIDTPPGTVFDLIECVLVAHKTQQPALVNCIFEEMIEFPKSLRDRFWIKFAQLKPFLSTMPAIMTTRMEKNWLNELAAVCFKHDAAFAPSRDLTAFMGSEFRLPIQHPVAMDDYFTDSAFMDALQQGMALKVENHYQGFSQFTAGMETLLAKVKAMFRLPEGLTETQKHQISQLSNMVNHQPMSLLALTHFTMPDNTIKAVEEKVLGQFNCTAGKLILADGIWMQVGDARAEVVVSNKNEVDIATTIVWPVTAFGTSPDVLRPVQGAANTLSTTVNVNLKFNDRGLETKHVSIGAIQLALEERLTFTALEKTIGASPGMATRLSRYLMFS